MVIACMFLGAIAFFACIMLINKRQIRIITSFIFGMIFVVSTLLMTLNYSHHFGMKQVTTTHSQRVYSASNSSMPLALYKKIGTNGQDNVLIYNTKPHQKTPNHTQANEFTTSKMKFTKRTSPRLITTETRWEFKNGFYKVLYWGSGMGGTLVKRTNVIEYPQTYVKLTVEQAALLKQKSKNAGSQSAMESQAKAYVTNKVQAAMAKDPTMTMQEVQAVTTQATEEFQGQLVRQMLK